MSGHDHGPVEAPIPHVLPLRVYWGVFAVLTFLTVTTVVTAQVDLGPFNLPLAMVIAVTKASLVAAIFMHLWFDHKLYTVALLASLMFASIFIVLTMSDLTTRGFMDPVKENFVPRDEAVQKYVEENPDDPLHLMLRPGMRDAKKDDAVKKALIAPHDDEHGDEKHDAAPKHDDGAKH